MTYNKIPYNKIRHLELLRRFLDLKNQGKDLYRENKNEYVELLHYQSRLEDHVVWKSRKQFVLLMDNLIHGLIDMEKFEITFSQLWQETLGTDDSLQMDLKRVENLQLDPRSDGFCSLVTCVYRQFEVLRDEECTEQEVKDYVQNILREI